MEINTIKTETKSNLFTCYYPKFYAEWHIIFRTVFGIRKEKIFTLGDGVINKSAIIDYLPISETKVVDKNELIAFKIKENEFQEICFKTLKKHYVYRRRSLNVPKITCLNTACVYIPYQIENKRKLLSNKTTSFLYEPTSKNYDKLSKHTIIQNFYLERSGKY